VFQNILSRQYLGVVDIPPQIIHADQQQAEARHRQPEPGIR